MEMAKNIGVIIEQTRRELNKLTGLDLSTTKGVKKEDNGWTITIEMIEKHSIPDQMDILALYEVSIDEDGNILSFDRTAMRKRMDVWISE
jgi:transcription initiation factor IIE alpha subunit